MLLIMLMWIPISLASLPGGDKELPQKIDGPYVFYDKDNMSVTYIEQSGKEKKAITDNKTAVDKKALELIVNTDLHGQTFAVKLKPKLTEEKSEYTKVTKMMVLSDIEANFKAFRTLLQANGVMDADYNWIFGTGHLVLIGDFFDRGDQQTQVLWLIYSLEEKAKAAKGYVHYILGNHEIMNLNGDHRYVHPNYMEHASLMQTSYLSFYGEQSELGRWLRTKNIVEKINDVLFVHGGISSFVNQMALPLTKVNDLARPYYADTTLQYKDIKEEVLYSDFGPFWYRGYYKGKPLATKAQIDSTLDLYGVNYIMTGHTIVGEHIQSYFDGKVFNTDVHHASGHSEALIIENKKFYVVNGRAERKEIK